MTLLQVLMIEFKVERIYFWKRQTWHIIPLEVHNIFDCSIPLGSKVLCIWGLNASGTGRPAGEKSCSRWRMCSSCEEFPDHPPVNINYNVLHMFYPLFPVWLVTLDFYMDFKYILLNHLNLWGPIYLECQFY